MKKIFYLLFILSIVNFSLAAQSITPSTVTTLPSILDESSGIEKTGANYFWSHNDSGGDPDIYAFDSSGTLLRTITISNAVNNDWEDIAQGSLGELYVGDFGNNDNDRSVANGNRLRIYIVPNPSSIVGSTTTAGIINFEYSDRNFSAPASNHNFDMESFFYYNDSLHLFTKNRTSPTNGWIKHYAFPSVAGTYTAKLIDSLNNTGIRITSADISPDNKTVTLLANNRIYLLNCFTGSRFLSTSVVTTLTIPSTQKEAIVFSDNYKVYITDEGSSGKLYRSGLQTYIDLALTSCVTLSNVILNLAVNEIDKGNKLSWVASLDNNINFTIERSVDGISFEVIGSIKSKNNTISIEEFIFIDTVMYSGTLYYRIGNYDINGKVSYSNICSIANNETYPFLIYPNPSKEFFTISFIEAKERTVFLYDLKGHNIFKQILSNQDNTIFTERLNAGVYFIQIIENDRLYTRRIIIQ